MATGNLVTDAKPAASILLVDDDEAIRSLAKACLLRAGYRVSVASGRNQVLSILENEHFDLVITDVVMPDFDGIEVIRAVRKHQPDAAILAMSGGGGRLTRDFCFALAQALGPCVPLAKPFHLAELLVAVEKSLAARPTPQPAA